MSDTTRTTQEQQAYELGVEHARNAASWIIDGNTKPEFIPAVLKMFEDGDPQVDDYLPRRPNLSGEFADDPTPATLVRETYGYNVSATPEQVDALADAYEAGVSDTFDVECERVLRASLA